VKNFRVIFVYLRPPDEALLAGWLGAQQLLTDWTLQPQRCPGDIKGTFQVCRTMGCVQNLHLCYLQVKSVSLKVLFFFLVTQKLTSRARLPLRVGRS